MKLVSFRVSDHASCRGHRRLRLRLDGAPHIRLRAAPPGRRRRSPVDPAAIRRSDDGAERRRRGLRDRVELRRAALRRDIDVPERRRGYAEHAELRVSRPRHRRRPRLRVRNVALPDGPVLDVRGGGAAALRTNGTRRLRSAHRRSLLRHDERLVIVELVELRWKSSVRSSVRRGLRWRRGMRLRLQLRLTTPQTATDDAVCAYQLCPKRGGKALLSLGGDTRRLLP